MPLSPAGRERLIGVLGMLGSDFPGERAAAGLLASRIMKTAGLAWCDLLTPVGAPKPGPASKARAKARKPKPQPAPAAAAAPDWRRQANDAARHAHLLSEWDRKFLREVVDFPRLSEKQAAKLREIVAKVHGQA